MNKVFLDKENEQVELVKTKIWQRKKIREQLKPRAITIVTYLPSNKLDNQGLIEALLVCN